MAHPLKHAESSAKKFGGKLEDYLPIHNWFDESKAILPDFRHRALRHHAEGIFLCERIFGIAIVNSEGKRVPVRYIGEQHVREDLGRIPTAQDWLSQIKPARWMYGQRFPIRTAGHARRFQPQRRKPSDLNSIHLEQWHLRSSLPGISKWPHLAQTNAPSESTIIGLNSLPTTQYGHRTTRSVIAATPLAVGARNKKIQKPATPRSHPRTARVARNVRNETQSTRQQ
jgi:hypothetical protein